MAVVACSAQGQKTILPIAAGAVALCSVLDHQCRCPVVVVLAAKNHQTVRLSVVAAVGYSARGYRIDRQIVAEFADL